MFLNTELVLITKWLKLMSPVSLVWYDQRSGRAEEDGIPRCYYLGLFQRRQHRAEVSEFAQLSSQHSRSCSQNGAQNTEDLSGWFDKKFVEYSWSWIWSCQWLADAWKSLMAVQNERMMIIKCMWLWWKAFTLFNPNVRDEWCMSLCLRYWPVDYCCITMVYRVLGFVGKWIRVSS